MVSTKIICSDSDIRRNLASRKPTTAADIRYTAKGDSTIYAFVLAKPTDAVKLTNLAIGKVDRKITKVEQLGAGPLRFDQTDAALTFTPKTEGLAADQTVVFKITLDK